MAEQLNHGEWKGNTAGSTWMHRTLIASFKIKPEEMADVKTLAQFCDYIESKVG